jgi:guanylate kinase
MREQESYGNPYYFTTVKNYMDMLKNNEFIQRSEFNNWFYGTALSELKEDVINIGVFNIAAIEQLLADGRIEVIPILVTAPDKTRLVRQLNREYEPDCTEICRRFLSDKEDYSDISFVYATYPNGGGSSLNTHCDRLEIILQEWQN